MKAVARIFTFVVLIMSFCAATAQQPTPAPDPNAPALTLDEKIALTTDDIKRSDMLEKAQKAFQEEIKPINDHQEALKLTIEKEHPGWVLQTGAQGWFFTKKQDVPKAPEKAETPKK